MKQPANQPSDAIDDHTAIRTLGDEAISARDAASFQTHVDTICQSVPKTLSPKDAGQHGFFTSATHNWARLCAEGNWVEGLKILMDTVGQEDSPAIWGDPSAGNKNTPLLKAASLGHMECVRFLSAYMDQHHQLWALTHAITEFEHDIMIHLWSLMPEDFSSTTDERALSLASCALINKNIPAFELVMTKLNPMSCAVLQISKMYGFRYQQPHIETSWAAFETHVLDQIKSQSRHLRPEDIQCLDQLCVRITSSQAATQPAEYAFIEQLLQHPDILKYATHFAAKQTKAAIHLALIQNSEGLSEVTAPPRSTRKI